MGVGRLPRTNKRYLAACSRAALAPAESGPEPARALHHSGKKFPAAPASHRAAGTRRRLGPFTWR